MISPLLLGNAAEDALRRFGVTPERVERLLRLQNGKCGCTSRKKTLNEVGVVIQWRLIMFIGGPAPLPWKTRAKIAIRKLLAKGHRVAK